MIFFIKLYIYNYELCTTTTTMNKDNSVHELYTTLI